MSEIEEIEIKKQHLEFDISMRFTICTEKDKKQLSNLIWQYLEDMPECYVCSKDFILKNIRLCDCEAYTDKLEECE